MMVVIEYNLFVPNFAPRYDDMVKRGGRPGISLEDPNRKGVWVPHTWLDPIGDRKPTWRQFTPEELNFLYAKKETT